MASAVTLYVNPSTACDPLTDPNEDGSVGLNNEAWTYLLNNVGKQRMLGQKASQLFTQVANLIAVEQSKVDLIIMVDTIERSIRSLIEGDRALNIYAPPTQAILDELFSAYDTWTEMKAGLEASISLDPTTFTMAQIGLVARRSEEILEKVNSAVQRYEDACIQVKSTVPARLINDAGRQRMVLMKMAKEAGLVQYGYERERNQQLLDETRAFFDNVHWMLLYGDSEAPGIPPTNNVCIVQQMKTVYDLYRELDSKVLGIAGGAKTDLWRSAESGRNGLLAEAFGAMHTAVGYYAKGLDCTPSILDQNLNRISSQEWEGAVFGIDKLQGLAEKTAAQYFLSKKDGRLVDSGATAAAMADLEAMVRKIRFGSGVDNIPAPLSQKHFNDARELDWEFGNISHAVATSDTAGLSSKTDVMVDHAKSLMEFYVGLARQSKTGQTLQMDRLRKINHQSVLVQTLLRYAAEARLGGVAAMDNFRSSLAAFETSHDQLLNGGGGVHAVIEERGDLTQQWEAMDAAWRAFKQQVESFVAKSAGSEEQAMIAAAENVLKEIEKAIPLYSKEDPEVPEKPPPFPYTQLVYAIIGTLMLLMICCVCGYFCKKHNSVKDVKIDKRWSDMMGADEANTNEVKANNSPAGNAQTGQATTGAVALESV
eukprot:TRINITY_DN5134_c0_g2_i5.p1 TRINITY_DN5134_c0_g2~~TRINITY_DN5134_c0_g2_i5.p1  ORF type:complete len:653 (-),score=156.37 TRINITY_DN5134_c0_g2_i5:140-2098(-)